MAIASKTSTQKHPTVPEIMAAKSLHVLTFSSLDELLLAESEGRFSMDDWDLIEEKARIICLGDADGMVDEEEKEKPLQEEMRSLVEETVRRDERWKDG